MMRKFLGLLCRTRQNGERHADEVRRAEAAEQILLLTAQHIEDDAFGVDRRLRELETRGGERT